MRLTLLVDANRIRIQIIAETEVSVTNARGVQTPRRKIAIKQKMNNNSIINIMQNEVKTLTSLQWYTEDALSEKLLLININDISYYSREKTTRPQA